MNIMHFTFLHGSRRFGSRCRGALVPATYPRAAFQCWLWYGESGTVRASSTQVSDISLEFTAWAGQRSPASMRGDEPITLRSSPGLSPWWSERRGNVHQPAAPVADEVTSDGPIGPEVRPNHQGVTYGTCIGQICVLLVPTG